MSHINYDINNPELEALIERKFEEKIASQPIRRPNVVFHNPKSGNWHLSLTNERKPSADTWTGPIIANSNVAREGSRKLAAGSLTSAERDHFKYNPYKKEFVDKAVRVNELLEKVEMGEIGQQQAAGIIANSDYQELINQVFGQELLDYEIREYTLEAAATKVTSDTLKVPLPDIVKGGRPVSGDLREFDIPDPFSITYEFEEISLKKSAARFEISTWFDLSNRRRNVEQDTRSIIEKDWPRIYDNAVRDRLGEFGTTPVGTAWDSYTITNYHYNADPTVVLQTAIDTITGNGGVADMAVMHPHTYMVVGRNSFMREENPPSTAIALNQANSEGGTGKRMPKVEGVSVVTSRRVTDGRIYFFDKRTLKDLRGPTRSGNYEEILGSYRGTLIERWYGSAIQDPNWGITLTGVVTTPSTPIP